jgi:hypothetical protein
MEKKSRKTKIKVVRLYWEWNEIDRCQQMEEEGIKQICIGYASEGGID